MAQTILVADDSITMRQVVTMAFKGSPYRVIEAGGGEEALQAAYEHRPSVILLDYHLPDRSGLEVCRAIKGDPNLRHIPVLMMGGAFHPFDEAEARRSGSNDVIIKPFKTDDIHGRVTKLAPAGAAAPMAKPAAPQGQPSGVPPLRSPAVRGGTQMGMPAINANNPRTPRPSTPERSGARYGGHVPTMPPPRRQPSEVPPPRFKSPGEPTRPAVATPPPMARQAPKPSRLAPPAATVPVKNASLGAGPSMKPGPSIKPGPSMKPGANLASTTPINAPSISTEDMRQMVREEVQRAVREEMLSMVKSVLGDLFKERMLPKLLSYGQERVEAIVTRDLQVIMERRVEEELARITQE